MRRPENGAVVRRRTRCHASSDDQSDVQPPLLAVAPVQSIWDGHTRSDADRGVVSSRGAVSGGRCPLCEVREQDLLGPDEDEDLPRA